jgi:ribosomal protein L24E
MIGADGAVYAFGHAQQCGAPTIFLDLGEFGADVISTPDGLGYWTLNGEDEVELFACPNMPILDQDSYEGTNFFTLLPGERAISMSSLPDGRGYWVFTNRGRALAFGRAQWYGDMSHVRLNGPVVGSVGTPSGHGYYMVASDGGIFSFGDARFHGSMGAAHLNKPVRSMAPTPNGRGYWLVASDGGIFAFAAPFYGSMGSTRLNKPVVGIVPSATGHGYMMVASDGGIFTFGDVGFYGSLGGHPPLFPITAVSPLRGRQTIITYRVAGTGSADVTFSASGSSTAQSTVALPWSHTVAWPPPNFPSVIAQLNGGGSIACTILKNGVVIAHATSSGDFAVVDC